MSYLVLARKWRPQRLSDLVGQEPISRILLNAVSSGKVAHAYVFSGPRGVGKTSSARILAKTINCLNQQDYEPCGKCASCVSITEGSSMDVIEIDGASNNSVDDIRGLRETMKYAPSSSRYKVYIIDEAHMLSVPAFNAFLKTIEEPPPHVIFVLATTEARKIPVTVLSRCQHLPFKRIPSSKIKARLKDICTSEGIGAEEQALDMIAAMAEGSMRDSLTILDQIISFSDSLRVSDIKDLFGLTDTETLSSLTASIIKGDVKEIIESIENLVNTGVDIKSFMKDLIFFVRNLMIKLAINDSDGRTDASEQERASLKILSNMTSLNHTALLMNELIKAELSIRQAQHPRVVLEMSLIKMAMMNQFRDIDKAISMLSSGVGKAIQSEPVISRPTDEVASAFSSKKEEKPADVSIEREDKRLSEDALSAQSAWLKALDVINETNHLLFLKLSEGTFSYPDEKTIIIHFEGGKSVHSDSVKDSISLMQDVLKGIAGQTFAIKVLTKKGAKEHRDLHQEALNNPIVQNVLKLYDGIITDVKENKEKGG